MKKFWIISELFHPDEVSTGYVMTRLAQKLSHEVDIGVICGPIHDLKILTSKDKLEDEIQVLRTGFRISGSKKLPVRLFNIFFLCIAISMKVLIHTRKGDKVIMVTNPPILVPFLSFLKKIKNFELNIIVHDVFPENAIAVGILKKSSIISKFLKFLYNKSYQTSKKLVVVGEDMLDVFKEKIGDREIPMKVITNWADHLQIYPLPNQSISSYYNKNLDDKVVLQFAGNIGRVQGLEQLFDLMIKVNNQNFSIMMIGNGAFQPLLYQKKLDHDLDHIHFCGEKPRDEQITFLNACHISIITLHQGMFGLGVPSKVYNVLAAGKPILYLGDRDSEISRYIKEYDVGWSFSWEQEDEIIQFFEDLSLEFLPKFGVKGKNSRRLAEEKFNESLILDTYSNFLQN
ncbi:MAG: glycosyltransferase WbuB [Balneolaceae bacterium]|nr:MAG: glycosyltransferase WbuB [Balneolaceae bacterium]